MASATDLVADHSNDFFTANDQPVIMCEDWGRDTGAQFGEVFLLFTTRDPQGFEGLKLQEVFDGIFHRRMKVEFTQSDCTIRRRFQLDIFCCVFTMWFKNPSRARLPAADLILKIACLL